ncbi:GrpB family protein [Nocardioides sp. NPDC006273]|uniref:GrpB family protein n=1 Tax=Nocardioides sp. NPDC006273 TaxID=3155598 RepID=UPI0033B8B867
MSIEVVAYDPSWQVLFNKVAAVLSGALADGPAASVEHVGSTSVPGLAAKPILDIDVIVAPQDVPAAVAALERIGYRHRGDLGVAGREAFHAPDDDPRRHVYVCAADTINVRNHLAVRDVLRERHDLRDEYAAVKLELAADPGMDMDTYIARKSDVLQKVLAASDLTADERRQILSLNDPTR